MFDSEKFAQSDAVLQAIELEDHENIINTNEMAKSTRTTDMDPERFTCILSNFSREQKKVKRNYLKTLPFYIEDKNQKSEQATA